ncbi:MAG TPA: LacI family DNA-binding transcriptional regulator [Thiolinea sp.]|nr:LacI family DNA-binding transcriptional regulator [Thiolinea sp.]
MSISTVDRVLTGRKAVKRATAERVLAAAQEIGFYAAGVIRHNLEARPTYTLGFLLQQGSRSFYRALAQQLTEACATYPYATIQARIEFMEDLSPHAVAEQMLKLVKRYKP